MQRNQNFIQTAHTLHKIQFLFLKTVKSKNIALLNFLPLMFIICADGIIILTDLFPVAEKIAAQKMYPHNNKKHCQ